MTAATERYLADEDMSRARIGSLTDDVLNRIRGEFREMPGLSLTLRQAARLWNLDAVTCDVALRILVEERYLDHSRRGTFRLAA
jgi:hypothetical protein